MSASELDIGGSRGLSGPGIRPNIGPGFSRGPLEYQAPEMLIFENT